MYSYGNHYAIINLATEKLVSLNNNLPAHIAFGQQLSANTNVTIRHNLSNSCGQSMSATQLCALDDTPIEKLLGEQELAYSSIKGSTHLRKLIAHFHQNHNSHEYQLSADDVLTFCGAQEALSAIYQTVFNAEVLAKDKIREKRTELEIVVITPCYPSLVTMAEQLGIKVRCLALNYQEGWQINQGEFLSLINENTRLIVLNSPHNPSGSIIDSEFSEKILAKAQKFNCYLLADDVSQASNYNQAPLAHNYLDYDRTIVVSVLSKSFGLAGLRIGWAVTKNKDLLENLLAIKTQISICTSIVDEKLAEVALEHHQEIIRENNRLIKKNIITFQQFIESNNKYFSWHPPQAGLLALVKCHTKLPMLKWAEKLAEDSGIFVYPACLFGLTGSYFRLGLGTKNFAEILGVMQRFIDENQGFSF